ncbi:hypothetical protein [Brevundimonas nasdae]|jgi:iron complex outermembrane recepter protein|nr:hypothetical protein [Brevundimonas nasdae]
MKPVPASAPIKVRASWSYADWLPSANIVIEPRENLLGRCIIKRTATD